MHNSTVAAALAAFEVACQAAGLSARTVAWYRMIVEAAFAADLEQEVSAVVTLPKLRAFLAELRTRHSQSRPDRLLSAATVAGYTRGLKRFGAWLFEEGYLPENPAARLKRPKLPKRVPKGVDLADLRRMVAVADVRERALLYFLMDTGCRAAEVCELRLDCLDLAHGMATVHGKGDKERLVYLLPPTVATLRAWLLARKAARAEGRVFHGLRGPMTPVGLYWLLKQLAARAGVEGRWNPHAFRHAYAREHLLNGGDLATLKDLLGHEDIQTTQVYTVFVSAELQRQHARCSPVARWDSNSDSGSQIVSYNI